MSPTLRNDEVLGVEDLDVVRVPSTRRAVRLYAATLLAIALGGFVAIALQGAELPLPAPVLLLAVPLALCMNRFVFFPNEVGVTADAAVVFAAMVLFHGDAAWLGPLLIALMVGPLDARHWGERAFVRMAYNSGSTALVTLAALTVFVALGDWWGTSWWALGGAAAVAAIPYVFVESLFGIVLVVLLGERVRPATSHQLPLNCIALPLAVFGAVAGLLGTDVSWWLAFVLLLPVPILPELLIVSVPRRFCIAPPTRTATFLTSGAALLTVGLVIPGTVPPIVADVAGISCLALAECRSLRGLRRNAGWLMPIVAVAVCLGVGWQRLGRGGVVVFVAGLAASLTCASVWGPLPWSSRIIGPMFAPHLRALRKPLLLACGTGAIVAGALAATTGHEARAALALTAAVLLETMVAMAALAVRMWRFAPRRRRRDIATLAAIDTAVLVTCLTPALAGTGLTTLVVTVGVLATTAIAWPLALDG